MSEQNSGGVRRSRIMIPADTSAPRLEYATAGGWVQTWPVIPHTGADRELYRESTPPPSQFVPRVYVTAAGMIGMSADGSGRVQPISKWLTDADVADEPASPADVLISNLRVTITQVEVERGAAQDAHREDADRWSRDLQSKDETIRLLQVKVRELKSDVAAMTTDRDAWRRWKEDRDRACGHLISKLETQRAAHVDQVNVLTQSRDEWRSQVQDVHVQRDEAIERVCALAQQWEATGEGLPHLFAQYLRDALSVMAVTPPPGGTS